jgi:hypothetical protein
MFATGTATDFADLLDKLDTFLTAKGSAFGLAYAGTGDGVLTDYSGGASSVAETFTITATSATSFTVVGSVSGSIGTATAGTPFAHAKLELLITAGGTAFVAGDVFTLSTAPKWTSKRRALGCIVQATEGNAGTNAAQNLVDGKTLEDANRLWVVSSPWTNPQDIEFTFRESETIASYQMLRGASAYAAKTWTLDYWNGSAWVTLNSQSNITDWASNVFKTFTIASPVAATRYRLHITDSTGGTGLVTLGAVRLLRATGVDASFAQVMWQAPGNDGDSEIFSGVHLFEREDADYYDWEVASFDGFTADASFRGQPGFQGQLFVPLWGDPIPYWFVADGRRCVVVAKINAQYEMAYLGLFDPYFSPEQWPYPVALGGTLALGATWPLWNDTKFRWSSFYDQTHRAPTHSDIGIYGAGLYSHQLRGRRLDGAWDGFEGSRNDVVSSAPGSVHVIWPYRCGLSLLDVNLDGSFALWPAMLCHSAPNTWGQLSGVACVTGQDLVAESLVRRGAVDWLVVQNINRGDRDDFLAVALD